MKIKVYIASPYIIGEKIKNVETQLKVAHKLMDHGFIPFIPLLSHYTNVYKERPYKDWIEQDLEWLQVCDFVLRLPGESKGADIEVAYAIKNEIPVVYDVDEFIKEYSLIVK